MTAAPDSLASQRTLLWSGDGGRPTYRVVPARRLHAGWDIWQRDCDNA